MDLLSGNIKQIYLKYLAASFGGAILQSVYGIVDMIAVGQYHGPNGAAAMAIIAPIWNVVFSFGLMIGIGASILFNIEKNSYRKDQTKANGYFTVGIIMIIFVSIILCSLLFIFENQILSVLGADEILLPFAKSYLVPVKFFLPVFLFMQFMAAFLRNDDNPTLSTKAVVAGGVFNIFGDIFFVFTLNMGILGAGIATCMGALISLIIMLTHFISKKNTLKIVVPKGIFKKFKKIVTLGFTTGFIDVAMGIATLLFNVQIMKYLGSDALAIYGIIVNIGTFVQCCAYGVGQASQPILSANYSVKKLDRIRTLFRYNILTIIIISSFWLLVTMLFPQVFVYTFMNPTESVLGMAPGILRMYCISFVLLPFNIYSTYYFQAIIKAEIAFVVSVARGLFISGAMILLLPKLLSPNSIWLAMPITEVITFIFIIIMLNKLNSQYKDDE